MIARNHLQEWESSHPWDEKYMVEQDLLLSRMVVALFNHPLLSEAVAFRGGTSLHKLYLKPQARYSEDLDLVQLKPGPIKPIMQAIKDSIDFFEEPRNTRIGGHGAKAFYKFNSEFDGVTHKIKLEINCREHFHVLPIEYQEYSISNGWFTGSANVATYSINELLGTKLRAFYQRKKGRDLFDLYYASQKAEMDLDAIIKCFGEYMNYSTGRIPTRRQFEMNIEEKGADPIYSTDMTGLLRTGVDYDFHEALDWVKDDITPLL